MDNKLYVSRKKLSTGIESLLIFSVVITAALLFPMLAGASALGTAGEFNTFIFGDYACTSDAEGRVAVGGNMRVGSYSVADKLTPAEVAKYNSDMLIVGGNLTFTSGRVYYGNIIVGGSASLGHANVADGSVFEGVAPLPVDFAAEEAYLKALSLKLSEQPSTGRVRNQWGNLKLSGDGQSDLQVFYLKGKDVLNAWGFSLQSVPQGATVLINISGRSAGLTNMNLESIAPFQKKILFNFYEATNLKLGGIAVRGSILAPLASVNNPMGVIWGTIIAASWNGAMQQNHVPFTGELPQPAPVTPPEATVAKYQRLNDSDAWTADPLYGLEAGDIFSYQISVENISYADDLGLTILDTLTDLVDFDASLYDSVKLEKIDANGNLAIVDASDYSFDYDSNTRALSLDYTSTLFSQEILQLSFDVMVNDSFGPGMVITNQADVKFKGYDPLKTNTVKAYAAVPEPATLFLFGAGLLGVFGVRRKLKR